MSRILVVEDSPTQAFATRSLIEEEGHDVELAENGRLALDAIARKAPDLIVTDLEMPEMDGLELVRIVRRDYPTIPIILVTAFGSEDVAVTALHEGAASYIPKKNLARDIGPILADFLEQAKAEREQRRGQECLTLLELRYVLPNDHAMITPVIAHIDGHLRRMNCCGESDRMRVGVALREALVNAIYHGNLEVGSDLRESDTDAFLELGRQRAALSPYRDRRIHFVVTVDESGARFVIEDDGPGFDPDSLPDPFDPENMAKPSGRGILLIRTFMDEVQFNPKGNAITMIKRRPEGSS